MSKIHTRVYVMAQDAPHLERHDVEHTKLKPALLAGSIDTPENNTRTLHTLLTESTARVAQDAATAITGDGWQCAPIEERVVRYVRIDRDAARITRAPERVEVPDGYTLLCRDVDGIKQYALVHSQILYTTQNDMLPPTEDTPKNTDGSDVVRTGRRVKVI